ncbi:hypothetical protein [Micromonospora arida]|uniref:aromatic-ring hydroxylase C-terminal domain-containing protein n=1 Tax=Micromonospora arida TaxID=2203715 RepID=UPI0033BB4F70
MSGTDVTITTMSSRTHWIDTAGAAWTGRVNTVAARTDRWTSTRCSSGPDGCVAWASPNGRDLDATTMARALGTWFGHPAERRFNGRLRFARYEVGIR